jgi:hypothetical protein
MVRPLLVAALLLLAPTVAADPGEGTDPKQVACELVWSGVCEVDAIPDDALCAYVWDFFCTYDAIPDEPPAVDPEDLPSPQAVLCEEVYTLFCEEPGADPAAFLCDNVASLLCEPPQEPPGSPQEALCELGSSAFCEGFPPEPPADPGQARQLLCETVWSGLCAE